MPRIEYNDPDSNEPFQKISNTRKTPKTRKQLRAQKIRLQPPPELTEAMTTPIELYPNIMNTDPSERPPFHPPLQTRDIAQYKKMYGPIGDIDLLPAEAQLIAEQRGIEK